MKKLLLLLFLTSGCLLSCKKDTTDKRTYEYFAANVKQPMDDKIVIKLFGEPDDDIGSGIHIFVYNLTDGTVIFIGVTDHIHYASHVDANGQLLHIII
jgi:hypothetical protein